MDPFKRSLVNALVEDVQLYRTISAVKNDPHTRAEYYGRVASLYRVARRLGIDLSKEVRGGVGGDRGVGEG